MRVLFVLDSLGAGGAEHSTAMLLPYLRSRGIDSVVATLYRAQEGSEIEVRQAGFDVTVLRGGNRARQILSLRRLIRAMRPDVIHTALYAADQVGRLAAWNTGVPVVSSLVTVPRAARPAAGEGGPAAWKLSLVDWFDARTRRLTTRFHAVSSGVASVCAHHLGIPLDAITVAERGRIAEQLGTRSPERRATTRRLLGITDDDSVVLAIGRLEPEKAHGDLVAAAVGLSQRWPTLRVLIAGRAGNASAHVRQRIDAAAMSGCVQLLGHRDDVPDLLAACDVMALPSHFEGNSGAVIEALGLGVPIASTDLAGQQGVLVDGVNALLSPPGDVAALERNIDRLLGDHDLRDRLSAHARATFAATFDMEASADRMAAMYRQVAALHAPAA